MAVACDVAQVLNWFHDQHIVLGKLKSSAIIMDEVRFVFLLSASLW